MKAVLCKSTLKGQSHHLKKNPMKVMELIGSPLIVA